MTPVSVHVEINKLSRVSPYCNNCFSKQINCVDVIIVAVVVVVVVVSTKCLAVRCSECSI